MRICCVVGAFPAVSETFIISQITGLLEQGHAVRIYAGARGDLSVVHEAVVRLNLLKHARFYNEKPVSRLARFFKFLAVFPFALLRAPGPVLKSLDAARFGREALSLNLFFRTAAFLASRDDDVILCHFGPNGRVGLQMKEIGALKGKLLTVFHASDITSYVRREGPGVYAGLFAKGDLCLAISEYAKARLVALGCPADKIRVHRMGVDLALFSGMPRKAFGTLPLKLFSAARLVEKKGILYALEAVAQLVQDGIRCSYTIAGDGPLRPGLEVRARALGIEAQVKFLGWQAPGVVHRLLAEADVLLAPSIRAENGDEEGIPVAVMEAMAAGVVVVTTQTGGAGELVMQACNGFIVPEKNGRAIAEQVKDLFKTPDLAAGVRAQAREAVAQKHDRKKQGQALERILTEIVDEG